MAAAKKFVISEALSFGWETIKKRFWFFAGLTFLIWVIQFFLNSLGRSLQEQQQFLWLLVILLTWFIEWGLSLGMYSILLKTADGQTAKFDDLFSKFDVMLLLRYFVASLLVGLAVMVGLLLLIVPGVIIGIRLSFYVYLLVDKNLGPVEAIKESWNLTKGNTWNLFLFGLVLVGINFVGVLAFVVGLLVTAPLSMLASVSVYRKLVAK